MGCMSLRPAAVIAGFLVLVKRGRILSLRMVSRTTQNDASGVEGDVVRNLSRIAVDAVRDSSVVHGSASEVKLASARTMFGTSAALCIGNREPKAAITEIDSDNLSLSSCIRAFLCSTSGSTYLNS